MATAGDLVVNLGLNSGKLISGLSSASGKIASFTSSAARGFATFGLAVEGVRAAVNLLGKLSGPIQLAAQAEQTEVAFTTMLGSAEAAKKTLGDLEKFAATTPLEQGELNDAARKLLAFNVSAEQLIPTLRRVGDVSAGIGAPIGEIAEIYGKAKVQGRLFMEDINQLTGRGIPVIQELAKQFRVTEGEVRGLVEKGRVNFGHLEAAFASLTGQGGKFFDMMGAQSQTAGGLWSTLTDNLTMIQKKFGELVMEGGGFKDLLRESIDVADDFFEALKESGPELKESFTATALAIGEIGKALTGTTERAEALRKTLDATVWVINKVAQALELVSMALRLQRSIDESIKDVAVNVALQQGPRRKEGAKQFESLLDSFLRQDVSTRAAGTAGAETAAAAGGFTSTLTDQQAVMDEHAAWVKKQTEAITKNLRTPLDVFEEKWRDLRILLDGDAISQEQYNASLAKLREELRKSDPVWKAMNQLFEQTRTPLEKFNQQMAMLDEMARRGAPRELLDRGLAKAREEFQSSDPLAKAMKAMQDDAKEMTKAARTPTQVFTDQIARLKTQLQRGLITPEVFRKNALAAEKEAAEAIDAERDRPKGSPAAIEAGSAAAFSAIVGAMKQKEELKELREIKEYLRQQAQKTPPATVISFGDA